MYCIQFQRSVALNTQNIQVVFQLIFHIHIYKTAEKAVAGKKLQYLFNNESELSCLTL